MAFDMLLFFPKGLSTDGRERKKSRLIKIDRYETTSDFPNEVIIYVKICTSCQNEKAKKI